MITKRLSFLMMILILLLAPTVAPAQQSYTEDFSTTTYMDAANTTADWNTTEGELKLHPFVMSLTGSYDTLGEAYDVVVSGDLALVADDSAGLLVLDISDPAAPVLAGSYVTVGSARGVAVSGNYAFVAAEYSGGLQVIDIRVPTNPTLVGSYNTPFRANEVAVSGDYAFVADDSSGLQIIDVSEPANPTLAGSYDTPGNAYGVAVSGNHAFVGDAESGLQVIDISDPANPVLAGSCDTPHLAQDVVVAGDYVFVADGLSGLQVVDVSDPTNPTLAGSYDTSDYVGGVDVSGDRAFVPDGSSGDLLVLDISDPTNPTLISSFDTSGHPHDVVVSGNRAFVANRVSGLQVIKISESANPSPVGSYDTLDYASDVAVSGDLAFVANYTSGLQVIDISDPATPLLAGSYDTPGSASALAVSGDHVFVADGSFGLQVIDVSNPASPTLAGSYDTSSNAQGVAVAGDHAFVAGGSSGLQVIDISDPTTPVLAGSYDTPDQARGVEVSGNHAFVADGLSGLLVIDISDPTNPAFAGGEDTPGDAYGVAVSGDNAFVADSISGLQVIDIGDPTYPIIVGSCNTLDIAFGVAVSGDHAFVANYISGLQVIDISFPWSPALVSSYDTPGIALGVTVSGYHAFVADYDSGLQVIQVRQSVVDVSHNIGQSLAVDGGTETINYSRLTSTETAGVVWDVSADAGANWTAVIPDGSWARIATFGDDLRWRSTHTWSPGVNPTVSELTLEWLNEFGPINSVSDVPDDQGGWVRIDFTRSGYDFADEPTLPVIGYNVYRQVDEPALLILIRDAESLEANTGPIHTANKSLPYPLPGMKITSVGDRVFVNASGATTDRAGTFPPGTWEILTYVAATQSDNYQVSVPTLAGTTTFLVTTHTTTPSEWFVSPTASGASIDNIAPAVPMNLLFSGPDTLAWDEAPDQDFGYHSVYGSENPVFDPSATLIGYTIAQTYDVSASPYGHYHLTTSDHSNNESGAASIAGPAATIDCDYTVTPTSGTLPFVINHQVSLTNMLSGGAAYTRRVAGRINVNRADGWYVGSWRAGFTQLPPGATWNTTFNTNLPAVAAVLGNNTFQLIAMDVTPAPYNQPPFPAAGDTDTAQCTVVGNAP